MKKLTHADHVDRVFMNADLLELTPLLDRAQLIVKMRQIQNGTPPAKRARKAKEPATRETVGQMLDRQTEDFI